MDHRKWTRLIFRMLSLLTLSYGVITSDDIRVDSKCYASYLQLNCDSPPNGVISIDWNATFFGQSVCMPDCGCNGETTCMVKVQNTSRIDCMPVTDYETVTYRCVPPDINSTAAPTLDPTTGGQTERWTNPETQTNRPVSQTTHDQGNCVPCECSCNTYIDAIIGVSVSLSLLLVLTAVVVGYVCYKRGQASCGGGNKQDLTNMIINDEYLTTIFPPDTGTGAGKEREVDQPNVNRQSSQVYESYEDLETAYEEPVGNYAGLKQPQYENTNRVTKMEVTDQDITPLGGSETNRSLPHVADVPTEEYMKMGDVGDVPSAPNADIEDVLKMTNMIINDENLTTVFPPDTGTGTDKERDVDHPNINRQSSHVYESYEGLETANEESVSTYAGFKQPQYDSNRLMQREETDQDTTPLLPCQGKKQ